MFHVRVSMSANTGVAPVYSTAFAVAIVALVLAERVGYDRVEVVPRKRLTRAKDEELSVGRIDELLARREPGGRRWPFVVFGIIAVGTFAALLIFADGKLPESFGTIVPQFFVGWTAWNHVRTAAALAAAALFSIALVG